MPRLVRREMRVLSAEQSRAFLEGALKAHYGPVFALALTTGMRPSEYLAVKWRIMACPETTFELGTTKTSQK